jgi:outer membrane protein
MLMRSSAIPAMAVLALAFSANAQQAPPKMGVISVQGAIVGTKDGQKASQELETKFAPKKKDIDTRQTDLAQLQDQYNKGGSLMNEDKRNQLARDIDEKKKRLERDVQDAQEELNAEQQKVLQGLGQRMMAVIEKYAKDNGYSMILDVSNPNTPVLYASSGIDITQDIISLYDKTSTNGGPAAKPGASATPPAGGSLVAPRPIPGSAAATKPPAPGSR